MPQFDPSSFASQLFWLAVMFTALYWIVSRIAALGGDGLGLRSGRYGRTHADQHPGGVRLRLGINRDAGGAEETQENGDGGLERHVENLD